MGIEFLNGGKYYRSVKVEDGQRLPCSVQPGQTAVVDNYPSFVSCTQTECPVSGEMSRDNRKSIEFKEVEGQIVVVECRNQD